MINIIIFLVTFFILAYRIITNEYFNWITGVFAFLCGAFLAQSIIWICGGETLFFS